MSFGFYAKNNNGQILFSDTSYCLEYIGKATLRTDIAYKGFNRHTDIPTYLYQYLYGKYFYDAPIYMLGYYDITAQASNMVAFSYVQNGHFTGIVYQHQIDANTTRLYVLAQGVTNIDNDPCAPVVYCFRKISPTPNTGHGIKIFDASGNETLNTSSNIMMLKAGAQMDLPTTKMARSIYGSLYSPSNNNGTFELNITDHACINTPLSMTKPAISFYSPATANAYTVSSISWLHELGVRYNRTSNIIQSQWGSIANIYSGLATKQIPSHSNFAMVIDGADYD